MATIKYLLQSTSDNANIFIRFSIDRKTLLKRKTGLTINPKDWNIAKAMPYPKSEILKATKTKLDKLIIHIETAYNNEFGSGITIDGDWLQYKIDIFNNKVEVVELDIVTNYIQKFIDDAPNKKNQKNELGLCESRIKGLISFKNLFTRFEKATNNKNYLIKDVNITFQDKFNRWLKEEGYAVNYCGKNIDNIKTICLDAEKNGIQVSPQLKLIKSFSESKEPEDIIYLSEIEQQKISITLFEQDSLNNAKKWLLLGCLLGQRVSDLLSITESNIKEYKGRKIIELKQQKTGKLVAIPILPKAMEIIESGIPHKISDTKFNEYIKVVCEKAEINEIVTGREKTSSHGATKVIQAPKYKLISSHVCRRSFATNFYGKIATSTLTSITGHSTEKMFLKYIGKTSHDHALQMFDDFAKI